MKSICLQLLFCLQLIFFILALVFIRRPLWHRLKLWCYRLTAANTWAAVKAGPPAEIRSGKPVAWLRVPGTGISHLVVHDATDDNIILHPAVTAQFSPLSGPGLRQICAHRDIHFRGLRKLRPGAEVLVEHPDSRLDCYRVTHIDIINRSTLNTLMTMHRDEDWLVLATCYPFYYIGPAPQRFLVWCRPAAVSGRA